MSQMKQLAWSLFWLTFGLLLLVSVVQAKRDKDKERRSEFIAQPKEVKLRAITSLIEVGAHEEARVVLADQISTTAKSKRSFVDNFRLMLDFFELIHRLGVDWVEELEQKFEAKVMGKLADKTDRMLLPVRKDYGLADLDEMLERVLSSLFVSANEPSFPESQPLIIENEGQVEGNTDGGRDEAKKGDKLGSIESVGLAKPQLSARNRNRLSQLRKRVELAYKNLLDRLSQPTAHTGQ